MVYGHVNSPALTPRTGACQGLSSQTTLQYATTQLPCCLAIIQGNKVHLTISTVFQRFCPRQCISIFPGASLALQRKMHHWLSKQTSFNMDMMNLVKIAVSPLPSSYSIMAYMDFHP